MLKCKIFLILAIVILPAIMALSKENTWRLEENQSWDLIDIDPNVTFLSEVSDIQNTVDEGKTKEATREYAALKENFEDFSSPDLDLFIKAELLLSKNKLSKSCRSYDKLLTKYPDSLLADSAIKRENEIGMEYLKGRKKIVFGIIPTSGDEEGISILEKMIDHAGYDKKISINAAIAIAKNYEKRRKFNEAYLKWYEIYSLAKKDATLDRDALLGMAKAKFDVYNKNPEAKKPFYDASCLRSAKSYYEILKSSYPGYAEETGVNETLNIIDEELAYKELSIGLYYQKTDNKQAANLYFNMVISDWPESKSAEIAHNMLNKNNESKYR